MMPDAPAGHHYSYARDESAWAAFLQPRIIKTQERECGNNMMAAPPPPVSSASAWRSFVRVLLFAVLSIGRAGAQQMHVLIATPCYGGVVTEQFHLSVVRSYIRYAAADSKLRVSSATVPGIADLPKARGALIYQFLSNPSYTHVFFVVGDSRSTRVPIISRLFFFFWSHADHCCVPS